MLASRPRILYGLCTYGIVLRELTDLLRDGDASRVAGFASRFAGVVLPGETLRIQTWEDADRILAAAVTATADT